MYPTPSLQHLHHGDYEQVYEPAEDTFLLLDALEADSNRLLRLKPTVCLEVGSGTGVVSAFVASILGTQACYFCTDINPRAAVTTSSTGSENRVQLNAVTTDLVESLLPRLAGLVDVLVFNPPYVVTPLKEVGSTGIEASYAGGFRGRQVMDRFFPSVASLLSPTGVFYLVIIKENDQDDIERVFTRDSFRMTVVKTRRSGPENLSVLRFTHKSAAVTLSEGQ